MTETIRDFMQGRASEEELAGLDGYEFGGVELLSMTMGEFFEADAAWRADAQETLRRMRQDIDDLEKEVDAYYLRKLEARLAELKKHPNGRHLVEAFERTGEPAIVRASRFYLERGWFRDFIPSTEHDKVEYEMGLGRGRADIVFFHVDGSITVVEAKDGNQGWRSVVAGIGQVGFYACQLGARNTGMKVRRALLWTTTGDAAGDGCVNDACELAGVVSMKMRAIKSIHADLTKMLLEEIDSELAANRRKVYGELPEEDKAQLKRLGLWPEIEEASHGSQE